MTEVDGCVGHHGAHGCRLGCPMKGHHKPHTGHYFAVHLKPNNYTVWDCNHPDIDIRNLGTLSSADYQQKLFKVISSTDQNDYERNCKETRIVTLPLNVSLDLGSMCGAQHDLAILRHGPLLSHVLTTSHKV